MMMLTSHEQHSLITMCSTQYTDSVQCIIMKAEKNEITLRALTYTTLISTEQCGAYSVQWFIFYYMATQISRWFVMAIVDIFYYYFIF